jgi:cobalamin biosynthesis Mg chelatase CobN
LIVTVVNVFGSWLGNFVTPGQTDPKTAQTGSSTNTQASASTNTSNNSNGGSQSQGSSNSTTQVVTASQPHGGTTAITTATGTTGSTGTTSGNGTALVAGVHTVAQSLTNGMAATPRVISINLAIVFVIGFLMTAIFILRKKFGKVLSWRKI